MRRVFAKRISHRGDQLLARVHGHRVSGVTIRVGMDASVLRMSKRWPSALLSLRCGKQIPSCEVVAAERMRICLTDLRRSPRRGQVQRIPAEHVSAADAESAAAKAPSMASFAGGMEGRGRACGIALGHGYEFVRWRRHQMHLLLRRQASVAKRKAPCACRRGLVTRSRRRIPSARPRRPLRERASADGIERTCLSMTSYQKIAAKSRERADAVADSY